MRASKIMHNGCEIKLGSDQLSEEWVCLGSLANSATVCFDGDTYKEFYIIYPNTTTSQNSMSGYFLSDSFPDGCGSYPYSGCATIKTNGGNIEVKSNANNANASVWGKCTSGGEVDPSSISSKIFGTGADGDLVVCDKICKICAKEWNFCNVTICPNSTLYFEGQGVPILRIKGTFCNEGRVMMREPLMCTPFNYTDPYSGISINNRVNKEYNCALSHKNTMDAYVTSMGNALTYENLSSVNACGGDAQCFAYSAACGIYMCAGGIGGYTNQAGGASQCGGTGGATGTNAGGGGGGSNGVSGHRCQTPTRIGTGGQGYNGCAGGNGIGGDGGAGGNTCDPAYSNCCCVIIGGSGGGGGFGCLKGGKGGKGGASCGAYCNGMRAGFGGNGGNSWCGDAGDGGDGGDFYMLVCYSSQVQCCTLCYGRGGDGGCSYYGNGGNGGYSTQCNCCGKGGCSFYGNGGNGLCGGNTVYGNGGNGTIQSGGCSYYGNGGSVSNYCCYCTQNGGNSYYGNGGIGKSGCGGTTIYGAGGDTYSGRGGIGLSGGNTTSGNGGNAWGGSYGLGLFANIIKNEGNICGGGGNGGNGNGNYSCGGNGGDGSELYIVTRDFTNNGIITYDGGKRGTGNYSCAIDGAPGKFKLYRI